MPSVSANGIDTYYEIHGEGPATPLVLSHGLGATSQQWLPHLLPLAETRPLILYDTRGHGKTTAPPDHRQYSLEIFAADLAGMLDAIGVKKAQIGGQSLGGMITANLAADFPSLCASAILSDTSCGNGVDEGEAGKVERWVQGVIGNRASVVEEHGLEEAMRREYNFRKENDPDFRDSPYTLDDYLRRARTTPAAGYAASARAIVARPDLTARLCRGANAGDGGRAGLAGSLRASRPLPDQGFALRAAASLWTRLSLAHGDVRGGDRSLHRRRGGRTPRSGRTRGVARWTSSCLTAACCTETRSTLTGWRSAQGCLTRTTLTRTSRFLIIASGTPAEPA